MWQNLFICDWLPLHEHAPVTKTRPAQYIYIVGGFVAYSYATRLVDMRLTPFARTCPAEYIFRCVGLWLIRMRHDWIICGWLHSHKPSAGYSSLAGSPCVTNHSYKICQWVMSHASQRNVLRITESWLMYVCTKLPYMIRQWVMSRESRSHVLRITESWLMYEAALYDTPMRHVLRINESCLANHRVMAHVLLHEAALYDTPMRHVSRINESCLANHRGISRESPSHDSCTCTKLPYTIHQWVMCRESRSHVSPIIQSWRACHWSTRHALRIN